MIDLIAIDGIDYNSDNFNDEERYIARLHEICLLRIRELEDDVLICNEIRSTFFADLKQEMLTKKAGIIF